ncbi:hypothetical protein [Priestia megaterium]|uniref:Uncharacterized protein n=1 Tax=Priestia megaterium TaxID=1404 RepID=A0A6M6E363_PRIMG|nr:hypothetical protein [Priestia megaterium]QJX80084.1 hypothetical protein FDZ14_28725 [Priestia megaterium]
MEKRQRSDKHTSKKKFKNVIKVNFPNIKKEKDTTVPKLKLLTKDANVKKSTKLKVTKRKQSKDFPIIETDEQFAEFVTRLSKRKKKSGNMPEVAASISNFNGFAEKYLETLVILTNGSNATDQKTITDLREQSKDLLKYLNDNAQILTPEERIQIIEQTAQITREIAEVHKRGKIIIEKTLNLVGAALVVTATVLITFMQSQSGDDNERDTIDMDDYN